MTIITKESAKGTFYMYLITFTTSNFSVFRFQCSTFRVQVVCKAVVFEYKGRQMLIEGMKCSSPVLNFRCN